MKSSQDLLRDLVSEFTAHPRHSKLIAAREQARKAHAGFLSDYPIRDDPRSVGNFIRTARDAEDFVRRLETDLAGLGGINLHSNKPVEDAGRKVETFRILLARIVDPSLSVWKKVDGQWGSISGFGGDSRQVAKKMANTYYPEQTVPVFNTAHAEHFLRYLRLDKDVVSKELYDQPYTRLSPGEMWHVSSEALMRERDKNDVLKVEDNVYLMYCLYNTGACPPGFKSREPHNVIRTL